MGLAAPQGLYALSPGAETVQHPIDPVTAITSEDTSIRDTSEQDLFGNLNTGELLNALHKLENFRRQGTNNNLFYQMRAAALMFVLLEFHLSKKDGLMETGLISSEGIEKIENHNYEQALEIFYGQLDGLVRVDKAVLSALSKTYDGLWWDLLVKRVNQSIEVRSNDKWMFDREHIVEEYTRILPDKNRPRVRILDRYIKQKGNGIRDIVKLCAPIRIELVSGVAADIFGVAMDDPDRAHVINISMNLSRFSEEKGEQDKPVPPINSYVRVIDKPVIRIRSVDLDEVKEIESFDELFNLRNDNLCLLKAAIIASGVVPVAMKPENGKSPMEWGEFLENLTGEKGLGIELVLKVSTQKETYTLNLDKVKDIPTGSGKAVSTMALANSIMALRKASGQTESDDPKFIADLDKYHTMALTILGEFFGGSGGGWQDSGGQWAAFKQMLAEWATPGDTHSGASIANE